MDRTSVAASIASTSKAFVCLILLTLLSACQNVPVEPFQAFSDSFVVLSEGSDQAIADLLPVSENRFKEELAEALQRASESDDDDDLDAAMDALGQLRFSTDSRRPLNVQRVPLFLELEKMRLGAAQAHAAIAQYGALLLELSDPELLSQSRFDRMASELNGTTASALNTLGVSDADEDAALFSTAATAAIQVYLQKKRKSKLKEAIEANQPYVESFALHMQEGVDLIAKLNLNEYDIAFGKLQNKATSPSTRSQGINELIELDRNYLRQVKTLNTLREAYGRLPAANRSLAAAVQNSGQGLAAIFSVMQAGQKLQASYESALATNRANTIQAGADRARAQANAAAARAEVARLEAANMHFTAEQARIASQADPDNETLSKEAALLAEAAATAAAEAEALAQAASDLASAADSVQAQADEVKRRLLGN